jgi:hypothetical protein
MMSHRKIVSFWDNISLQAIQLSRQASLMKLEFSSTISWILERLEAPGGDYISHTVFF